MTNTLKIKNDSSVCQVCGKNKMKKNQMNIATVFDVFFYIHANLIRIPYLNKIG